MGEEFIELFPIGDKVLLRQIKPAGSNIVVVSENSKADDRMKWLVVRVGPEVKHIKVGDFVAAGPSCLKAKFQGSEFFLAEEKGIFCIARVNPEATEYAEGITVKSEQ